MVRAVSGEGCALQPTSNKEHLGKSCRGLKAAEKKQSITLASNAASN